MPIAEPVHNSQNAKPDTMTVEEIERACEMSEPLDFIRHEIQVPELRLRGSYNLLGFPVDLRTNSEEILRLAHELWHSFEPRFETEPIRVDVYVLEDPTASGLIDCPPPPRFHIVQPLLINIADSSNYSFSDMERGNTSVVISRSTLVHANYLKYFFLSGAPFCHIATRYTTPIHAGCVALDGRGILLCGDSGAGKSSLSYACARAGWTYITDDASMLLNEHAGVGAGRIVIGNCHQVRFRPSAGELFPEVDGLAITPRAAGKPSIELPTAGMDEIVCAPTAQIDFIVFLNRRYAVDLGLRRYRKDVGRYFMRQVLYGTEDQLKMQYSEVERLLTAEVLELRYRDLDWAVQRLEALVREGR